MSGLETFKANAAKQDKTISELAKPHQIHSVQISPSRQRLLDGPEGFFGGGAAARRLVH